MWMLIVFGLTPIDPAPPVIYKPPAVIREFASEKGCNYAGEHWMDDSKPIFWATSIKYKAIYKCVSHYAPGE